MASKCAKRTLKNTKTERERRKALWVWKEDIVGENIRALMELPKISVNDFDWEVGRHING